MGETGGSKAPHKEHDPSVWIADQIKERMVRNEPDGLRGHRRRHRDHFGISRTGRNLWVEPISAMRRVSILEDLPKVSKF